VRYAGNMPRNFSRNSGGNIRPRWGALPSITILSGSGGEVSGARPGDGRCIAATICATVGALGGAAVLGMVGRRSRSLWCCASPPWW
jgi:hypothetical protein